MNNLGKKAPKGEDDNTSSFGTDSDLGSDIQVIDEEESGLTSSKPQSKFVSEHGKSSEDSLNMGSVPISVVKKSHDTSKNSKISKKKVMKLPARKTSSRLSASGSGELVGGGKPL